jgi:hypothetical protein
MDDRLPDTEPAGSLVPSRRVPPVAQGMSAPVPPRGPSSDIVSRRRRAVRDLVTAALDALDTVGDRIADAVGLR